MDRRTCHRRLSISILVDRKKGTRDFSLGQVELPASVDADLQLDLTGWLWTTVGSYAVVDNDCVEMDLIGRRQNARPGGESRLDLQWRYLVAAPAGTVGLEQRDPYATGFIVGVKGARWTRASGSCPTSSTSARAIFT